MFKKLGLFAFLAMVAHEPYAFSVNLSGPRVHIGGDFGFLGTDYAVQGSNWSNATQPTFSAGIDVRIEAPVARYFSIVGIYSLHYDAPHRVTDSKLTNVSLPSILEVGFLNLGLKIPVPIDTSFGLIEPYFMLPVGIGATVTLVDKATMELGAKVSPVLGVQFVFENGLGFFVESGVEATLFVPKVIDASAPQTSSEHFYGTLKPTINAGFTICL